MPKTLQEETLEQFKEIVFESKLDKEDKKFLIANIEILLPEYVLLLVDFLKKYPQKIEWLMDNIKERQEIFHKKDSARLASFLEKQKEEIIKLSSVMKL